MKGFQKTTINLHPTMVVLSLSWVNGPTHNMELLSPFGGLYITLILSQYGALANQPYQGYHSHNHYNNLGWMLTNSSPIHNPIKGVIELMKTCHFKVAKTPKKLTNGIYFEYHLRSTILRHWNFIYMLTSICLPYILQKSQPHPKTKMKWGHLEGWQFLWSK